MTLCCYSSQMDEVLLFFGHESTNVVSVPSLVSKNKTYAMLFPIPCRPLHSMVISPQSFCILRLTNRLALSSSLIVWVLIKVIQSLLRVRIYSRLWWRKSKYLSQILRSIRVPCMISLNSWSERLVPAGGVNRSWASARIEFNWT